MKCDQSVVMVTGEVTVWSPWGVPPRGGVGVEIGGGGGILTASCCCLPY